MANMVTITEARFCELMKREETLDAYRKAYGEMQKERDELMRKIVEIRRAMYVFDRTDRARLEEIEKIIGSEETK